ncbi:MAG: hypothetical protein JNL98_19955 [Bryobacterales bacterium]|nr:hypothetical protein [Bryobacterales bacterium]
MRKWCGISIASALPGLIALLTSCGSTSRPQTEAQAPAADIPFQLTLNGFSIAGVPGLHSYVMAGTGDKLVLFGGRLNGLHSFPQNNQAPTQPAFPPNLANDTVYVVDLVNKKLLGKAPVTNLPAPIQSQMKANNAQYTLQNGWIYVVGGYGGKQLGTLNTVTAIDFNALVDAVVNATPLDATFAASNIAQASSPALAITGGDLEPFGGNFLLAFGHLYNGQYTPSGSLAYQTYSDSIRVISMQATRNAGKPSVTVNLVGAVPPVGTAQDPENPYHRRDLTVRATLNASGQPRVTAYGGVFKGGRMEGFLNPMYIDTASASPGIATTNDTATTQLLSQYDCAAIVFAGSSNVLYTTFFGGISYYYWDDATKSLKHDAPDIAKAIDGLPFINSISTLKQPATGPGQQYLHTGQTFPPSGAAPSCPGTTPPTPATLLGAETKFALAPGVSTIGGGVIQLSGVTKPSAIGYLVGGIASTAPYSANGTTCASSMFYEVTLNPSAPTSTVKLTAP